MACFLSKIFKPRRKSVAYTVVKTSNISYGALGHQRLDQYRPQGLSGALPSIILITGGSFSSAVRSNMDARCRKATALGYNTFTISYAVPPVGYAAQTFADVEEAIAWAKTQAFVDPARVASWGHSAGAMLAIRPGLTGLVKCAMGEAGPYEVVPPAAAATNAWLNGYDANDASPLFNIGIDTVPMFLAHGSNDTTVPILHSQNMKAAMDTAGKACILHTHTGNHDGPTTTTQRNALWAAQQAFFTANL